MTFKKTISTLIISTAVFAGAMASAQANPIETVSIAKDGIDVVAIEVQAGANSFTSIKSTSHKFTLKLYAKAKWGKKVRRAKVASGTAILFEASPAIWNKTYNNNSRTFQKSIWQTIPMSKITFSGNNPVQACNEKLASHRNALTSGATAQVTAYFDLQVTNKTKITSNSSSHEKNGWMWYPVKVKCLPKAMNKAFTN